MTKGIDRYEQKKRREVRRRNHVAKDLHEAKYRQRVKPRGPRWVPDAEEQMDDE